MAAWQSSLFVVRVGNELSKAEKYFGQSKYHETVKEASELFENKRLKSSAKLLESLPTERDLLDKLIGKLKGKSVSRTLRKIEEGKIIEGPQFLKGLFSLGAHIAIEVEKGGKEYAMLYPVIYEKLGEVLYKGS